MRLANADSPVNNWLTCGLNNTCLPLVYTGEGGATGGAGGKTGVFRFWSAGVEKPSCFKSGTKL